MIRVIVSQGLQTDNHSVEKVFALSSLEEFQLWLKSLTVYPQHAGHPFDSKTPIPKTQNFRPDLRNSMVVLRDEIHRCPVILLEELEAELEVKPETLKDRELKAFVRENDWLAGRFGDFVSFWESLQKYLVIGLSVARHQFLSRAEFRAYSLVLATEISRFLDSESFLSLVRNRSRFTFHHIIHRDILDRVEVQGTREELERVFRLFFEVLSTVQYCQEQIQKSFKYQKLTVLLTHCYSSYQDFLKVLDQADQYLKYTQPSLAEAVESVKFGLRLEIRRIFNQELRIVSSEVRLPDLYSNMESGLGLLKHASRQSFTSLVRELNPDFDELELFQELKNQQSIAQQLNQDLTQLYDMARDPETQHSDIKFARLLRTLRRFRKGSMKVLYFKDWQPFEQFNRELETTEPQDRAFVLHRLEVYLSTLIGEVGKQAILHRDGAEIAQGF